MAEDASSSSTSDEEPEGLAGVIEMPGRASPVADPGLAARPVEVEEDAAEVAAEIAEAPIR